LRKWVKQAERKSASARTAGVRSEAYMRLLGAADVQAEGSRAAFGFFPRLLAAERGEVKVGVAVVELFDATAERAVGVGTRGFGSP
jgi:hypothetical protein